MHRVHLKRHTALLALLTLFAAVPSCLLAAGVDDSADGWADIVTQELKSGHTLPVLSNYVDDLDLALAYRIQRALVAQERRSRKIGGYKGGFTSSAAQQRFKLEAPASGVLFADGRVASGAEIDAGKFYRLMVELELGFELLSPIRRPMKSTEDLKTYIRYAVPVIELPDLKYESLKGLTGLDVIATNIGSKKYLVGRPLVLKSLDEVNLITAELFLDGELIDQGPANKAMGDQLKALLWLVNHLYQQGWPLEAGQILITGTLGKINPAGNGHYEARYAAGHSVEFDVSGVKPPDSSGMPAQQ